MGKSDQPVADYYPPGVTEPIVRPANIPAATAVPQVQPLADAVGPPAPAESQTKVAAAPKATRKTAAKVAKKK